MPSLNWIGKDAVLNHHRDVPYRLLKCEGDLSNGDPGSGNLLIEGDNLEALKALLPYYKGKVKCIYIDPPYNTGNEGWQYNDNVNSPQVKKWLGETVGIDRLDRHDRWLCMMWPRLILLREFLRPDGVIFVSIDDCEAPHLRLLLDAIFGESNFQAQIVWQKKYSAANDHTGIAPMHDYLLVYSRSTDWSPGGFVRDESKDSMYRHKDDLGRFRLSDYTCNKSADERKNLYYPITNPNTGIAHWPDKTRVWFCAEDVHLKNEAEGLVWWGHDGTASKPQFKRYLHNLRRGSTVVPHTWWTHEMAGHTDSAAKALRELFGHESVFATPKPPKLVELILQVSGVTDSSLILDSFAGSGTTGQVVSQLSRSKGDGSRGPHFILIEMLPHVARDVTAQRLAKTGASFRYCTLGETLFTADGMISGEVTRERLAHHVWFTETGEPLPHPVPEGPVVGEHLGHTIALIEGPLTVRSLRDLPLSEGGMIVYADACRVDAERLASLGIVFKAIPYDVRDA